MTGGAGQDDVARAVGGDEAALSRLLLRHAVRIRRSITIVLPPRLRALLSEDDVLQQTFTDAFLDVDRFTGAGEEAFAAWLARLARNNLQDAIRALDAVKRGGKEAPRADDANSFETLFVNLLARTRTTPSGHAVREEMIASMRDAIDRLPADHARVVRLYDLESRPIAEVAAALGRSEGATFLLRHRAHRRLRDMLGGG